MLLNAYPLAGDAKVSIFLKIEKGIHFFYVFWNLNPFSPLP